MELNRVLAAGWVPSLTATEAIYGTVGGRGSRPLTAGVVGFGATWI